MSDPKDTRKVDVWLSGTEEPEWLVESTDEGAQKMAVSEPDSRRLEQEGRSFRDDRLLEDELTPDDELMILNMGPQHPSTHGVLRLNVELEGEIVRRSKPIIGYLHTGMEKTGEELNWLQGPTNVTRMDYLAPFHNELAYSLAVEKLLYVLCVRMHLCIPY